MFEKKCVKRSCSSHGIRKALDLLELWCSLLLEFLETPGISKFSSTTLENSWNILKNIFNRVIYTNQNLQMHLSHDCTLCISRRLNFRIFSADFGHFLQHFTGFDRKAYEPHSYVGRVLIYFVICKERVWGWVLEK